IAVTVPHSSSYRLHQDLLASPTRRSSDLSVRGHVSHRPSEKPLDLLQRWHAPNRPGTRAAQPRSRIGKPQRAARVPPLQRPVDEDRKSTRLNSRHVKTSYAVFCVKTTTFA